MTNIPADYMFREHSPGELVKWTRRLSLFRYVRAAGGMANDGDRLLAIVAFPSTGKLTDLLVKLGFNLSPNLKAEIEAKPHGLLPLLRRQGLVPKFFQSQAIWFGFKTNELEINISGESGDPYAVTESDVVRAEELERFLKPLQLQFRVPPWSNDACFSEVSYPEFFKTEG